MLNEIFKSLLIISLMGTCLAAVITLIKPLTKRVFGSSWHYYIYLAVLVVMVMPARFDLPQKPEIRNIGITETATLMLPVDTVQVEAPAPAHHTEPKTDIFRTGTSFVKGITGYGLNIPAYLWLFGAVLMLLINIIGYIRLIIKMRKNSVVISCPQIADFTRRKVTARVWENTSSPFMVGIFKPVLVLPARELTEEQLNNILRHEMTHFKRHDILYKWFAALVKCAHWFNPMVWYVIRQINTECEISCDAAVTLTMNKEEEMSYIDTVLALLPTGKTKQIPFTTQMASSKRVLKRRFEMIRDKRRTSKFVSALSAVIAIVMLGTTVFASGILNGSIRGNDNIIYEVYNGDKKISLNSQPFIYDGEYYLPLRDVLNGFDITDIKYDSGVVDITFPYHPTEDYASKCRFIIGKNLVYLDTVADDMKSGVVILGGPILQDGKTYIPLAAIEEIMRSGQMTDFLINIIRPTEPEYYYTEGEKVFIGTAQEQDSYNGELVKRIIVDENGETIAVVPIENQIADNVEQKFERAEKAASFENYYHCFYNSARSFYDTNERCMYITELNLIQTLENPYVAYIAPADIIKIPENEFNKGLRQIVTNTYKNKWKTKNSLSVRTIMVDENNTVVYKGENLINPESTIKGFFKAFADSNFALMKNYCTANCRNTFFGDGYCFGMTKAELIYMGILEYTGTLDTNESNYVAQIRVKMTPHEVSVFLSNQTETEFYLILQKQSDGRYLIDEFVTGL